jgi:hypothetical protein
MSEIHIHDPEVRPESLCGYTGPAGEGDATCAACIAVDEHLVFPSMRMDRIREYVVPPSMLALCIVAGVAVLTNTIWLAWLAVITASAVVVVGVPLSLVVEYIQLRRRRGELVTLEA